MTISEQIADLFISLRSEERKDLLSQLYKETEVLKLEGKQVKTCPHCKNISISKYGKDKGEQRFKCSSCSRTFKETTGTALAGLRNKTLFLKFQDSMLNESYSSIGEMSKRFGISIPTAFNWRHKVLLSLPEVKNKFEHETEIDDIWIGYSQKGRKGLKYSKKRGGSKRRGDNGFQVKILTTTNASQTEMKVTNIGRLSKSDIERTMGGMFTKQTILISDKHRSIKAFSKDNSIIHHTFKSSEHTDAKGKGVQRLNNIASRLNTLLNRTFKGVSTKYLQLYVNWFKTKENHKKEGSNIDLHDEILSKKYIWDLFSNLEKVYGVFIETHSKRTYRCPQKEKYKAQNWNNYVISKHAFF